MNQNLKASVIRASDFLDERLNPVSHHLFHAFLFSGILLFGALGAVEMGKVNFMGQNLPPLCLFKGITSFDCPGCGITRSFVLAMHGQWYHSYLMHLWGIPLAAILVFQVPYRVWRAAGKGPLKFPKNSSRWVRIVVLVSVLLPWCIKTVWTIFVLAV